MPEHTPETTLYPESIAAILDQRPDPDGRPPSILTSALGHVLAARLAELRSRTDQYETAIAAQTQALCAERTAQQQHADERAITTARCHEAGLTGTNQAARDADLAAKLLTELALALAEEVHHLATLRRIEAEGFARQCQVWHQSLRVEIAGLTALMTSA